MSKWHLINADLLPVEPQTLLLNTRVLSGPRGCFSVSDTHQWKHKSRGQKKKKKTWLHHVSFSAGENVLTRGSHATRLQTLKEVINQSRLFLLTINYALTFHSVFMIRKAWVIYVDGGSPSKCCCFPSWWPPSDLLAEAAGAHSSEPNRPHFQILETRTILTVWDSYITTSTAGISKINFLQDLSII